MNSSRAAFSVLALGMATLASGATPVAPISPELKAAVVVARLFDPKVEVPTSGYTAYVNVQTVPGRTQDVFFSGKLHGPTGAKSRLIYAVAANYKEPISPALAVRLLKQNLVGLPFGAWALGKTSSGTPVIMYTVDVPVNAPAATIREVVTTIAVNADALDLELTGKDSQ